MEKYLEHSLAPCRCNSADHCLPHTTLSLPEIKLRLGTPDYGSWESFGSLACDLSTGACKRGWSHLFTKKSRSLIWWWTGLSLKVLVLTNVVGVLHLLPPGREIIAPLPLPGFRTLSRYSEMISLACLSLLSLADPHIVRRNWSEFGAEISQSWGGEETMPNTSKTQWKLWRVESGVKGGLFPLTFYPRSSSGWVVGHVGTGGAQRCRDSSYFCILSSQVLYTFL